MDDPTVWLLAAFGSGGVAATMLVVVFPVGVLMCVVMIGLLARWEHIR